jgi:FixJ family two-component response regulator
MDTTLTWVAVIDDDAQIRRALLRLLRSEDIKARAFANGAEFLAALDQSAPVCAVIDVHMSGMSGFEVLEQLAQRTPAIPTLMISAQHSPEIEKKAIVHASLGFLAKPMDAQAVLTAIWKAIDEYHKGDRQMPILSTNSESDLHALSMRSIK